MESRNTTLQRLISNDLDEFINSVFKKYQDRLLISCGDIYPEDSLTLSNHVNRLSELVSSVILSQEYICNNAKIEEV